MHCSKDISKSRGLYQAGESIVHLKNAGNTTNNINITITWPITILALLGCLLVLALLTVLALDLNADITTQNHIKEIREIIKNQAVEAITL